MTHASVRRWLAKAAAVCIGLPLAGCATAPPREIDRTPDLGSRFEGVAGAFVLIDLATDQTIRIFPAHCAERISPCSTFKVPHALIGLDLGVIADEDTVFAWDGQPKAFPIWERNHTLASAIRYSVVWWFQRLAPVIGKDQMARGLARLGYGNENLSSPIDRFWLYPYSLRISPDEQIRFLAHLYRGETGFDPSAEEIVRRIIVLERAEGWVLSGKTGSGFDDAGHKVLHWFIGHVWRDGREAVFACNVFNAAGLDGVSAQEVAADILRTLGWIP